jgi:hypothetical protein
MNQTFIKKKLNVNDSSSHAKGFTAEGVVSSQAHGISKGKEIVVLFSCQHHCY